MIKNRISGWRYRGKNGISGIKMIKKDGISGFYLHIPFFFRTFAAIFRYRLCYNESSNR